MNLGNIGALAQSTSEGIDKLVQEDWMQKEYKMKQQEALQLKQMRELQMQQIRNQIQTAQDLAPLQKQDLNLRINKTERELAKLKIGDAIFSYLNSDGNIEILNTVLKDPLVKNFVNNTFGGVVRFESINDKDINKIKQLYRNINLNDKNKRRFVNVIDDEGHVHMFDILKLAAITPGIIEKLSADKLQQYKIKKLEAEIKKTEANTKEAEAKAEKTKKEAEVIEAKTEAYTQTQKELGLYYEALRKKAETEVEMLKQGGGKSTAFMRNATFLNKLVKEQEKLLNKILNTTDEKERKLLLDQYEQNSYILNKSNKPDKLTGAAQKAVALVNVAKNAKNLTGAIEIAKKQLLDMYKKIPSKYLTDSIKRTFKEDVTAQVAYGTIASILRHSLYAGNLTEYELKEWNRTYSKLGYSNLLTALISLKQMLTYYKGSIDAYLSNKPANKLGTLVFLKANEYDKIIEQIDKRINFLSSLKNKPKEQVIKTFKILEEKAKEKPVNIDDLQKEKTEKVQQILFGGSK